MSLFFILGVVSNLFRKDKQYYTIKSTTRVDYLHACAENSCI